MLSIHSNQYFVNRNLQGKLPVQQVIILKE